MGWIDEPPFEWVRRAEEQEKPWEEFTSEDRVWTTVLVERSVDLQQVDPDASLRVACTEAIDRHRLGERVDLISFGDGPIQQWELPIPARVGQAAAATCSGLTDHTYVDLHATLRSFAVWDDGPEFFVLLCSAHIHVDPVLLYAGHRNDGPIVEPHWPVPPPTAPELTTQVPRRFENDFYPYDDAHNALAPGGRTHACFAIGAIGAEPSPALRHLAELSGGLVLPIRHAADADTFGAACSQQFRMVVASVEAGRAEANAWLDGRDLDRETDGLDG